MVVSMSSGSLLRVSLQSERLLWFGGLLEPLMFDKLPHLGYLAVFWSSLMGSYSLHNIEVNSWTHQKSAKDSGAT